MKRLTLALLFLLPAFCLALDIKGEEKVKATKLIRLSAADVPEGAALLWQFDEDSVDAQETKDGLVGVAVPGVYKFKLLAITLDKSGKTLIQVARKTVTVEGQTPPSPPGPDPTPGPGPQPVAPMPAKALRVLIVYESADLANLPAGQANVMYAKSVRDYLRAKCDAEDGATAWRIWDKDVDASGESKVWQEAIKRERKSVPWIIVSNGKTGFEGALPASVDDTLKLLKKYGGE